MECSCGSIFKARSRVAVRIPKHKHPINDLLDLLGRRWTLRILWELRGEPLPFRRLREACDEVSTSVLTQRLRDLQEAGIVEAAGGAYGLTPHGRELCEQLIGLDRWAKRWAARR